MCTSGGLLAAQAAATSLAWAMVNFGDEGQAATWPSVAVTGSPSRNRTPRAISTRRSEPFSRRQWRSADLVSKKTIASAVSQDRQPLVLSVRRRTVANVLSIGLAVRTCFQCSAGTSWRGNTRPGAFDDDARAADLIQAYEARIAALERLVGKPRA